MNPQACKDINGQTIQRGDRVETYSYHQPPRATGIIRKVLDIRRQGRRIVLSLDGPAMFNTGSYHDSHSARYCRKI